MVIVPHTVTQRGCRILTWSYIMHRWCIVVLTVTPTTCANVIMDGTWLVLFLCCPMPWSVRTNSDSMLCRGQCDPVNRVVRAVHCHCHCHCRRQYGHSCIMCCCCCIVIITVVNPRAGGSSLLLALSTLSLGRWVRNWGMCLCVCSRYGVTRLTVTTTITAITTIRTQQSTMPAPATMHHSSISSRSSKAWSLSGSMVGYVVDGASTRVTVVGDSDIALPYRTVSQHLLLSTMYRAQCRCGIIHSSTPASVCVLVESGTYSRQWETTT